MELLEQWLRQAFCDADLREEDLPNLDLYMDQILTLLDGELSANKRHPTDKLVTKTMINNYSKEHLIQPVRGKKYTRLQMLQLLCVLNLKQTLSLTDVKALMEKAQDQASVGKAYGHSLELKDHLRKKLPVLLKEELSALDLSKQEDRLAMALALSSASTFLRRLCETMLDNEKDISDT